MNNKIIQKSRPLNITNPPIRRNFIRKQKAPNYEYVLLLHKVGIKGMSRQRAEENLTSYKVNITEHLNDFGNMKFKNIIVPSDSAANDISIEVLCPTVDHILNKLSGKLSIPQERKFKIFKLLEETIV